MTSSRSETGHLHTAFGLAIRSCLPLLELHSLPGAAATDVEIVEAGALADLPEARKFGAGIQALGDQLLLQINDVARYLVSAGRRITFARLPGISDDDVRAYLLTSAFGALLHQRQDLVLHGSAIAFHGEAVVFLGTSGAGKSTTAAAFRRRGHPVMTDDLCVVRPGPAGRLRIQPSFPHMKLWLDSLAKLELSPDGLRPIRHKREKRALPLGAEFALTPLPLRKIYVLEPHAPDQLVITPIEGPAKLERLKRQTYRFGFLAAVGTEAAHFRQALKLAQQVPLAMVQRPVTPFRLDELVALVEADLRSSEPRR